MASTVREFRVHVQHANGTQGFVQRVVSNVPEGLDDAGAEQYVRDLFAKLFPDETYPKGGITPAQSADEPRQAPRPGMFPRGVTPPTP